MAWQLTAEPTNLNRPHGSWRDRYSLLNGFGDVAGYLGDMSGVADRIWAALAELPDAELPEREEKFGATYQRRFNAGNHFAFALDLADGLDQIHAALDELPLVPKRAQAAAKEVGEEPKREGGQSSDSDSLSRRIFSRGLKRKAG